MAPDTDPTDDELAAVMAAARDLAVQRRVLSDAWIAARLATESREACLREGRSLAFETVFSASDKVEFVRRGIAAGFFLRLFFVGTDGPEINAARVAR
ncbi:MAG: hypothetical protein IPK82_17670 [Polyangiaceae bacterium]|nr:hypothetical protein [Polyangiaceae bacterium]